MFLFQMARRKQTIPVDKILDYLDQEDDDDDPDEDSDGLDLISVDGDERGEDFSQQVLQTEEVYIEPVQSPPPLSPGAGDMFADIDQLPSPQQNLPRVGCTGFTKKYV